MYFVIYRDEKKEWWWKRCDPNNRTIANSDKGYRTARGARMSARRWEQEADAKRREDEASGVSEIIQKARQTVMEDYEQDH